MMKKKSIQSTLVYKLMQTLMLVQVTHKVKLKGKINKLVHLIQAIKFKWCNPLMLQEIIH
jgi:hypothetical protein